MKSNCMQKKLHITQGAILTDLPSSSSSFSLEKVKFINQSINNLYLKICTFTGFHPISHYLKNWDVHYNAGPYPCKKPVTNVNYFTSCKTDIASSEAGP